MQARQSTNQDDTAKSDFRLFPWLLFGPLSRRRGACYLRTQISRPMTQGHAHHLHILDWVRRRSPARNFPDISYSERQFDIFLPSQVPKKAIFRFLALGNPHHLPQPHASPVVGGVNNRVTLSSHKRPAAVYRPRLSLSPIKSAPPLNRKAVLLAVYSGEFSSLF